jgi:Na+/H+-dicarboxylate symporter
MSDIAKLSRIGSRTLAFYLLSTVIAVTLGLGLVNIIKPGESFSVEQRDKFKHEYAEKAAQKAQSAKEVKDAGPLQFLVDIVPNNIMEAATKNKNMLQVIFFSILFGIALIMIPPDRGKTVKDFFGGVNDVIIKMVEIIMEFAPYGVFALLAGLIVEFENPSELFAALGMYCLTVLLGLLGMIFVIYPLVLRFFTQFNYRSFFEGILPAQMLAFSTSSSAATLPVTMECVENNLGVSKEVTSFVLPLGATINMDGTSLYQAVAAVFIAQAFGIDLTIADQLTIVLTATLASIGAAAVPGAGTVMLVIVLGSIGMNPEGIALIFAVDRILDMCRTVVNVTGDSAVASIIGRIESLHKAKQNIIKE